MKQLGAGDAQHPSAGHPTGVVRLTPPGSAADRATFFRKGFFAGERWRSARDGNNNKIQRAWITFDVRIGNRELGSHRLLVDYGPYRNVRGRATTVLHWGDLMTKLRANDRTDWWLLIERGTATHQLTIMRDEPS
jgi:hypothetical protein